jgi:hypothetical protein
LNGRHVKCIFCLSATGREPVEHIFPEGLVGHRSLQVAPGSDSPKYLILEGGEVCRKCNHKLGGLDEYLQEQFGFLRAYWNSVGTKKGNPASAFRPGMYAVHTPNGPDLHINGEDHQVSTPDGVRIPPAASREDAVRVTSFQVEGQRAMISFEQPVRMNKRFVRALHKIGFELLCFRNGADFVLEQQYDSIRDYILRGRGNRDIAIGESSPVGSWEQPFVRLRHEPSWTGWLAIMRLGVDFYVDLSPGNDLDELRIPGLARWSDQDGGRLATD